MKKFAAILALGVLVFVLSGRSACAQQVTVRLFSTQRVEKLTATPLRHDTSIEKGSQRPVLLNAAIVLTSSKDGIRIANPVAYRILQFAGALRLQQDGAAPIAATGRWTIRSSQDGMQVLLTTSVEHYVAAALNGEAAPDEPLESLKAMAVTARTFALTNMGRHQLEHFDLCDSTHCQALRFGTIRPEIREAVLATSGENLWNGTHHAHTYQTQNCGGRTEDAADVWPNMHAGYLLSHADPYCVRRSPALWHASINLTQLAEIFQQQHWTLPEKITSVHVAKRSSGDRVLLLEFQGNGKSASVSASSLRFAINRALGWNQLRSDWYDVSLQQGTLLFNGKGYGHGVGLCQAGSFEMAKEGKPYRDILGFYFPGTTMRITAADKGWQGTSHRGWTLVTSNTADDLLSVADEAWSKAQMLFTPHADSHPVVRLMPSTELFRQATDEPGWMLASTRGNTITLQPISVLRAHNAEASTLLHEFLHVLVEQEAGPQTLLWLREGLVEALAEPQRLSAQPIKAFTQMETALADPGGMAESQAAHLAAGQYTEKLIRQYGLTTVRGWLHTGIPSTIPLPH